MQYKYLINDPSNDRLIIFFTGWSTDWKIVDDIIIPDGYDLLCFWDYREIETLDLKKAYREAIIIAWSFGVKAAERFFSFNSNLLNVTGRYAINGTSFPVHAELGISPEIFEATLTNLTESSLNKFRLRICGSRRQWLNYSKNLSTNLSIKELKEELNCFRDPDKAREMNDWWDYAFISENDKIFSLDNQKKGWNETPFGLLTGQQHLPDFQKIINLIIKDKSFIGQNFEKSVPEYEENASVQIDISNRLIDIVRQNTEQIKTILEIGGGSGYLSKNINNLLRPDTFSIIDLAKGKELEGVNFIRGDVEDAINRMPTSYFDLVISGSTLQWVQSPSHVLMESERILKADGLFLFSTFIEGTFKEIYDLTGNTLLYLTEDQWKTIIKRTGFELIQCETDSRTLWFDDKKELFHHLKSTGVNSLSSKGMKIGRIRHFIEDYPVVNGKFPLTYNRMIMLLKKSAG